MNGMLWMPQTVIEWIAELAFDAADETIPFERFDAKFMRDIALYAFDCRDGTYGDTLALAAPHLQRAYEAVIGQDRPRLITSLSQAAKILGAQQNVNRDQSGLLG